MYYKLFVEFGDNPRHLECHYLYTKAFYIVGVPGEYAVKACGNNRIVERGLPTLQSAREWIWEMIDMDAFWKYNLDIQTRSER